MLDKLLIFSWRSCYIAHLSLLCRQLLAEWKKKSAACFSRVVVNGRDGETQAAWELLRETRSAFPHLFYRGLPEIKLFESIQALWCALWAAAIKLTPSDIWYPTAAIEAKRLQRFVYFSYQLPWKRSSLNCLTALEHMGQGFQTPSLQDAKHSKRLMRIKLLKALLLMLHFSNIY